MATIEIRVAHVGHTNLETLDYLKDHILSLLLEDETLALRWHQLPCVIVDLGAAVFIPAALLQARGIEEGWYTHFRILPHTPDAVAWPSAEAFEDHIITSATLVLTPSMEDLIEALEALEVEKQEALLQLDKCKKEEAAAQAQLEELEATLAKEQAQAKPWWVDAPMELEFCVVPKGSRKKYKKIRQEIKDFCLRMAQKKKVRCQCYHCDRVFPLQCLHDRLDLID